MAHTEVIRVNTGPPSMLKRVGQWLSSRSYWTGPLSANSPEIARLWSAAPVSAGVPVNEQTALAYSAVWAAVSLIASDVASLPLILYKREKNDGKTRFNDHKLYRLLHDEPNPEMTSMTFRETLQAHLLTWGNAYAEIERDAAGRPLALWPLTPNRVHPFRDPVTFKIQYRVTSVSGQSDAVLAPSDVLHIPGLGYDGVLGYSVIHKARESIGLGIATERFGGTFFGNGATFGGVFEHPTKMSEPAQKNFKESINAAHQGVDRAHKFLVVEEGMKYSRLGIPPNDAQFLETRKFQINEIARWFGIPPHKIGDLDRATFSNIEQQDIEYYKSGLRRWLVRWEQEINRKLIAPAERNIQFVEHNVEGLLRGDSTARAAFYSTMFNIGAYSINMILEKENMNQIGKEGDVHFVPANTIPAEFAIQGGYHAAKTVAATPPNTAPGDTQPAPKRDDEAETAIRAELEAARKETNDERLAREGAEKQARTLASKHAKATARVSVALTALAEAEAARQASEGNLEKTLAHAALVEARAATLLAEVQSESVAAAAAQEARDNAQEAVVVAEAARQDAAAQVTALTAEKAQALADVARIAAELDEARAATEAAAAALETARATPPPVDPRLAELDAKVAALTADRMTAAAEKGRLAAERDQAIAEARTAAAALEALRTTAPPIDPRVAEQEARIAAMAVEVQAAVDARSVAEAQRLESEAAGAAVRQAEDVRRRQIVVAHRALVASAYQWMIQRETDRARKAYGSPEKFRRWVEQFYPMHEEVCRGTLRPVVQAWLAATGSAADVDQTVDALVTAHLDESKRQLAVVVDEADTETLAPSLERVLRRWDTDRANVTADRLLKEGMAA